MLKMKLNEVKIGLIISIQLFTIPKLSVIRAGRTQQMIK